jgi:hypothetical protein
MKFNELYKRIQDDSENVITEGNMKKNVDLAKAGKAHKLTDDDLLDVHGYFENLWDRDSDNDDTYQGIVSSLEKEIEKRGFTQESKKVDGAKSEWAKHLRPELKRKANKQARKSAKNKLRKIDEGKSAAEIEIGGDYEFQKEMSKDISNKLMDVYAFYGKDIQIFKDKDDEFDLTLIIYTLKDKPEWALEIALQGQGEAIAKIAFENKKKLLQALKKEGAKLDTNI